MKYITVFCGASEKAPKTHREAAKALGRLIADNGFGLVYGGVQQGLMGEIAEAVLKANGRVVGVITPNEKKYVHKGTDEIIETEDYDERHKKMAALSIATIYLPGGLGTTESIVKGLLSGTENKPICFLNVDDFYTPLLAFFQNCNDIGYVEKESSDIFCSQDAEAIVEHILTHFRFDEAVSGQEQKEKAIAYTPVYTGMQQASSKKSAKEPPLDTLRTISRRTDAEQVAKSFTKKRLSISAT